MNIEKTENIELKDTKDQKNGKKQEKTQYLKESIQRMGQEHKNLKEQEKNDSSENNGFDSYLKMINFNKQSDDSQLQTEYKTLKQNKKDTRNKYSDSSTSSVKRKPQFFKDLNSQTILIKKRDSYKQKNEKISQSKHTNNLYSFFKSSYIKSQSPRDFYYQKNTNKKKGAYQRQNSETGLYSFDELSSSTGKITVYNETMLDDLTNKKNNAKSSREHEQEIPRSLLTKNENPKVVDKKNIASKECENHESLCNLGENDE